LKQVHTHYDNLKVARDAPPEVIRAAYRSLSQKYHPDCNPGDPKAARIMRIINASYEVLSDPAKRREHDEWISGAESEPDLKTPPSPEPPSSPVSPAPGSKSTSRLGPLATVLALGLSGFVLVFVAAFEDSPSSKSGPSSPGPRVLTPREVASPPAAASPPPYDMRVVVRSSYVRPALTPNGEPWPTTTGYVSGYKRLHRDGLSSVTVDNSQIDSDVFVKLVYRGEQQPLAARVFFIRAREQFTIARVRAGIYDIRYRDLDSGVISKSETFELKEIEVDGGVQYSKMQLTLYKVHGGNMRMETISEEEF
jgi:curved DNA-binding protein CbpA